MNSKKHTIYTLKKFCLEEGLHAGQTVSFHVYETHVVVSDGSCRDSHSFEDARKMWYNCVGQGYTLSNKSVVHDMKKFHAEKRNEEVMRSISESMEKFVEICVKSSNTNYALEA